MVNLLKCSAVVIWLSVLLSDSSSAFADAENDVQLTWRLSPSLNIGLNSTYNGVNHRDRGVTLEADMAFGSRWWHRMVGGLLNNDGGVLSLLSGACVSYADDTIGCTLRDRYGVLVIRIDMETYDGFYEYYKGEVSWLSVYSVKSGDLILTNLF